MKFVSCFNKIERITENEKVDWTEKKEECSES